MSAVTGGDSNRPEFEFEWRSLRLLVRSREGLRIARWPLTIMGTILCLGTVTALALLATHAHPADLASTTIRLIRSWL